MKEFFERQSSPIFCQSPGRSAFLLTCRAFPRPLPPACRLQTSRSPRRHVFEHAGPPPRRADLSQEAHEPHPLPPWPGRVPEIAPCRGALIQALTHSARLRPAVCRAAWPADHPHPLPPFGYRRFLALLRAQTVAWPLAFCLCLFLHQRAHRRPPHLGHRLDVFFVVERKQPARRSDRRRALGRAAPRSRAIMGDCSLPGVVALVDNVDADDDFHVGVVVGRSCTLLGQAGEPPSLHLHLAGFSIGAAEPGASRPCFFRLRRPRPVLRCAG